MRKFILALVAISTISAQAASLNCNYFNGNVNANPHNDMANFEIQLKETDKDSLSAMKKITIAKRFNAEINGSVILGVPKIIIKLRDSKSKMTSTSTGSDNASLYVGSSVEPIEKDSAVIQCAIKL
jgi:hypothetical protein